ncbi:uncharacterized protein LOC114190664 isoform X2 [Vigna unguiculata]|uniref:Uncharacterized protein n=1 Tax=Vigna unguiculata TaxID=3917 RepID=A0A4D6N2J2_VIGUN|nr:uncharacterized protein LOC114190664 isoform X2 [Vigna unguiculata]QCE07498.1 hypothetical protein DEO72_LG9g2518 [Vigna unguiculata]
MEFEEAEDEEWDTRKYSSKNNAANGCMMRWVLVGKKILVAGFIASATAVVVPPLAVASAIGIAVSMPYAVFLASYVCTQNLMSKLLPRPTLQDPPLLKEMCFQQGGSDGMQIYREEQALVDELKRDIEMDGFRCMKNGGNVTFEENNGVQVQPFSEDYEEFKTPFEVTSVVLQESQDQPMEGDIEEAELQRETKGLLENIRDEGRTDMTRERGEYAEGICGGANERDQKIGSVEDRKEALVEAPSTIGGTEEDLRKEEMMLHLRIDESMDTMLEGKESDTTNDSRKLAEPSELLIPAEPVEGLPTEALVYNIPMDENSSQDSENQESQMHELNERMYLEDAEAREIANDLFDGKQIDPDENAYTIDLHEECSIIGRRTDSMEVVVSSVEQESWPSECSSEENIICSSEEVALDDEKMWKEINVIRKIVGYEGRKEASCADELKALYMFTGVEPPTSLNENSIHPLEIKEKLQFLMSILGIKSNMT